MWLHYNSIGVSSINLMLFLVFCKINLKKNIKITKNLINSNYNKMIKKNTMFNILSDENMLTWKFKQKSCHKLNIVKYISLVFK